MKRIQVAALWGLLGILAAGNAAWAGSGAGAIILSFPIGARYNALGEAGSALAQDATASWWNPGGLAFVSRQAKQHDLQIMQSPLAKGLADDIGLYWMGYAGPLGDSGTLGVYINYLDMGEQQGTDSQGNPTALFSSNMYAIGAVYGVAISENLGVGLGIKYFRDKLAPDDIPQDASYTPGSGSGDSFGVDLGVLYKVRPLRTNFALVVANLGPNITHVDARQSDPMPRKVQIGVAHQLFATEAMWLIAVGDLQVPLYSFDPESDDYGIGADFDQQEWGFGAEWSYLQSLFIRFGYTSASYGDIQDSTYGFGVDLARWTGQAIFFDYASVPQAKGLPRVDRFSLGYRF